MATKQRRLVFELRLEGDEGRNGNSFLPTSVETAPPPPKSSFREVVRELDDMQGSRVFATVRDPSCGHTVAHLDARLRRLDFAETGTLLLQFEGDGDTEIYLDEEVYDEGVAWTGGVRVRLGKIELEVSKIAEEIL